MSNLGEAGSAFAVEVCIINFLYQFSAGMLLEQNWLCQLLLQLMSENVLSQMTAAHQELSLKLNSLLS